MTGHVLRIDRLSRRDGPGTRSLVLLKGCPLHCPWCEVPEAYHLEPELVHWPSLCVGCLACVDACHRHAITSIDGEPVVDEGLCGWCGDCADSCPSGSRRMVGSIASESMVIDELARHGDDWREGGGVTFSGGEPLLQPDFLSRLLELSRSRGWHTAVSTSGFALRDTAVRLAALTDLVLFDVKHLDDARHRAVTGVSNHAIMENLSALAAAHVAIVLRLPLVPGWNDDDAHVERVGALARRLGIQRIELLPVRRPGVPAFRTVGRRYEPPAASAADSARLRTLAAILADAGADVAVVD